MQQHCYCIAFVCCISSFTQPIEFFHIRWTGLVLDWRVVLETVFMESAFQFSSIMSDCSHLQRLVQVFPSSNAILHNVNWLGFWMMKVNFTPPCESIHNNSSMSFLLRWLTWQRNAICVYDPKQSGCWSIRCIYRRLSDFALCTRRTVLQSWRRQFWKLFKLLFKVYFVFFTQTHNTRLQNSIHQRLQIEMCKSLMKPCNQRAKLWLWCVCWFWFSFEH